jgi:hypothetical protein
MTMASDLTPIVKPVFNRLQSVSCGTNLIAPHPQTPSLHPPHPRACELRL